MRPARKPDPASAGSDEADVFKIGAKIKRARLRSGLRLKDLAEQAGCSESMVSRIENNRAVPSLTTLHRLCHALNTSISHLLDTGDNKPCTVLRPHERQTIGHEQGTNGEGTRAEILVPYAEGRLLEGFVVIIQPGGHSGGPLHHDGEETGYVIEGQLELTVNSQVFLLNPGDSFHFQSDMPHSYRNPGATVMRAVWINTPASF